MPCSAANFRIYWWIFAASRESAGIWWSKSMMTRFGSKTCSPPISENFWMASGPVISWIMAPSMGVMTTSPALISLPHFREKIFSTIVAPMLYRLYYTLCRHMYFGGSFSFQLYPCLFTGFFLIIANSFAVKAIFNRPGLQYPVGYTMRKTAVLTFALVVLTLALIGCAAADSTNDHVIQVSGSGSVTGTPDRVQISFAVKTYQVTNTLQVTLKDTNTTGQVIDTAVNAGANQVNSIQFLFSDEKAQALRGQALTQAVGNA